MLYNIATTPQHHNTQHADDTWIISGPMPEGSTSLGVCADCLLPQHCFQHVHRSECVAQRGDSRHENYMRYVMLLCVEQSCAVLDNSCAIFGPVPYSSQESWRTLAYILPADIRHSLINAQVIGPVLLVCRSNSSLSSGLASRLSSSISHAYSRTVTHRISMPGQQGRRTRCVWVTFSHPGEWY